MSGNRVLRLPENDSFEVVDRDGAVDATSAANPKRYGTAATSLATFSVHFSVEFQTTWVNNFYLLQRVLSHSEAVTLPKCAREGRDVCGCVRLVGIQIKLCGSAAECPLESVRSRGPWRPRGAAQESDRSAAGRRGSAASKATRPVRRRIPHDVAYKVSSKQLHGLGSRPGGWKLLP